MLRRRSCFAKGRRIRHSIHQGMARWLCAVALSVPLGIASFQDNKHHLRLNHYHGMQPIPFCRHSNGQFQTLSFQAKEDVRHVKCLATTESRNVTRDRMLVFVPPHPLIKHWISVLRNELSPCPIFRSAMAELGRLLIYEASREWLPTVSGEIQSPLGTASVEFIDPREPVTIVPILRAGLVLVEHASSVLPATQTYHVGISRDESSRQPTFYLNKLPEEFPNGSRVLVADPMLATGRTIVATIDLLKDRGIDPKQIRVVSAIAAPPALQKLSEKFPGLHVYTGALDSSVDENGFIIPGFGDAGNRSFGTR